jgi:hypothetical protein
MQMGFRVGVDVEVEAEEGHGVGGGAKEVGEAGSFGIDLLQTYTMIADIFFLPLLIYE